MELLLCLHLKIPLKFFFSPLILLLRSSSHSVSLWNTTRGFERQRLYQQNICLSQVSLSEKPNPGRLLPPAAAADPDLPVEGRVGTPSINTESSITTITFQIRSESPARGRFNVTWGRHGGEGCRRPFKKNSAARLPAPESIKWSTKGAADRRNVNVLPDQYSLI